MDERGLSAAAVATDLHVEEQTIRIWRSQGVPPRRKPHVERYMREWTPAKPIEPIDDAVQRLRASDAIVLNPSPAQLDRWDRASRIAGAETLKDWINDGLDALATQHLGFTSDEGNRHTGTEGP